MGDEAKYEGIRLLFDGLQQPVLNKQVIWYKYNDNVIQKLHLEQFTFTQVKMTRAHGACAPCDDGVQRVPEYLYWFRTNAKENKLFYLYFAY